MEVGRKVLIGREDVGKGEKSHKAGDCLWSLPYGLKIEYHLSTYSGEPDVSLIPSVIGPCISRAPVKAQTAWKLLKR